MASTATTASRAPNTLHWNKDSYYHPKIHYVTEGLKSSQSARQYQYQLNAFLRYLGIGLEKDNLVQLLMKEPEEIEELISEFLVYLHKERHLAAASINLAKSAIVHFFKRNRVKLDTDWISGYVPAEEGYKQDRPYTHEEIRNLLDACSEDRIRVAILLMASTGGEIISEASPLLREQFDPRDSLAVSNPRKIMETTLTKILRVAINKAGIRDSLAQKVKQTHGFRKFAITMMDKAGVKDTHRRYLTGHSQVAQDGSYVLPSSEDLLTEYLKAENLLTLDPSQRLQKKVQQLENQQEQEISQLKAQLYETKKELELVQKQTNDVVGWIKTYYDPHLGRRMQISSADQTPREMANGGFMY